VLQLDNRIPIGWGKDRQVRMLAVYPDYRSVRNLVLTSGRFFDWQDEDVHHKVGVMQHKLAQQLYGSVENASGKIIQLNGLPVTLIGTFQEKVDTFGQSEVTDNCILIPYSVGRYFTDTPEVEQLYFSVSDSSLLKPATQEIRSVIQSRHRPESNYIVQNLSSLIRVAEHSADALTLVLILITAVTLLVSGIGIMNIMLVTVKSRVFEIGIRKAVGATDDDIRLQFLSESVLISLIGGIGGVVLGLAIPLSIRFLTPYQIPISGLSAAIAVIASAAVGIAFGTMPAARAARLDPVICLRSD
jgi:putative ABC transport system permease protein